MTASSLLDAPVTQPATDVDALEAAFRAPAAAPVRPTVAPADVPDTPRAAWSPVEVLVAVLFATLALGVLTLVAITTFG